MLFVYIYQNSELYQPDIVSDSVTFTHQDDEASKFAELPRLGPQENEFSDTEVRLLSRCAKWQALQLTVYVAF